METEAPINALDRWQNIPNFVKAHPQFKIPTIRWYLRNRKKNGFDKVTRKVGKQIMINEDLFLEWLEKHATY